MKHLLCFQSYAAHGGPGTAKRGSRKGSVRSQKEDEEVDGLKTTYSFTEPSQVKKGRKI